MQKSYEFRGREFQILCFDHYPQHPSWYTFEDERDLREAFWEGQQLEGGVFLDCGAAFGSWSLSALAAGAEKAYAWSPQHLPGEEPEAAVLQASLALNGWGTRCTVWNSALYDKAGYLNLGDGRYHDMYPGQLPVKSEPRRTAGWTPAEGTEFLWKPCMPLDEWTRSIVAPIRWIKVDVEGAEAPVLAGAQRTILKHKPAVIVEHHLYMKESIPGDVAKVMALYGYKLARLFEKSPGLSHGLYLPEK